MKSFRFYLGALTLLVSVSLWIFLNSSQPTIQLATESEQIQISDMGKEIIKLVGTWTFYDQLMYEEIGGQQGVHVTAPHEWESNQHKDGYPYGYGTYVMNIAGLQPNQYYGIFIYDEAMAYRLRINDQLILESGTVAKTKELYQANIQSKWSVFQPNDQGQAKLVLEIANYDYHRGGMWTVPEIGTYEAIKNYVLSNVIKQVMLFVSLFLLGQILIALYVKMKLEKSALWMGLFSIVVALRVGFTDYRLITTMFTGVSWQIFNRIEYILGYLMLPLAGYIAMSLGYAKGYRVQQYMNHTLLSIAIAIPLFTTNHVYTAMLPVFRYLIVIYAIYAMYLLAMGIYHKKPGAIPLTCGYVSVIGGAVAEFIIGDMPFSMAFSAFVLVGIFTVNQIVMFSMFKKRKDSLEAEIIIDALTSVYNRLYLEELINGGLPALTHHKWYVIFIDVNQFKAINDTHGHHIGDQVLVMVAKKLKASIRDTDLVFRYGGDEFVIMAAMSDDMESEHIVNRIHDQFNETIDFDGIQIDVRVSIGITEYDKTKEKLSQAILRSDKLMYMGRAQVMQ